jgi:hypothetical protein
MILYRSLLQKAVFALVAYYFNAPTAYSMETLDNEEETSARSLKKSRANKASFKRAGRKTNIKNKPSFWNQNKYKIIGGGIASLGVIAMLHPKTTPFQTTAGIKSPGMSLNASGSSDFKSGGKSLFGSFKSTNSKKK